MVEVNKAEEAEFDPSDPANLDKLLDGMTARQVLAGKSWVYHKKPGEKLNLVER